MEANEEGVKDGNIKKIPKITDKTPIGPQPKREEFGAKLKNCDFHNSFPRASDRLDGRIGGPRLPIL